MVTLLCKENCQFEGLAFAIVKYTLTFCKWEGWNILCYCSLSSLVHPLSSHSFHISLNRKLYPRYSVAGRENTLLEWCLSSYFRLFDTQQTLVASTSSYVQLVTSLASLVPRLSPAPFLDLTRDLWTAQRSRRRLGNKVDLQLVWLLPD